MQMNDSLMKAFENANRLSNTFDNVNAFNKLAETQPSVIDQINNLGKGAITAVEKQEKLLGN